MDVKDFTKNPPGHLVATGRGTAFLPNPLPPSYNPSPSVSNLAERALVAIGEFRGMIHSLPNQSLLAQAFVRREAVLSSQIEGTRSELGQLLLFEIGATDDPSLLDQDDAKEVHNYLVAHDYAIRRLDDLPICGRLLRETHAKLLADVRGERERPGEYRTIQNFIGRSNDITEARFVPPPPEAVPDAMADLEEYINRGNSLPTLIRFALIHYQFEVIHPFRDGNGRLGRLLMALLLRTSDILPAPVLYLSAYLVRHRQEYMDHLLAVSQQGAWQSWVEFFLQGVLEAAIDAVKRSRTLLNLRETYREEFQRKNAGALLALIDELFRSPVMTNRRACDLLNVTYNAAQRHISTLAEAGILEEVTGRARRRIYMAEEILRVLQQDKA